MKNSKTNQIIDLKMSSLIKNAQLNNVYNEEMIRSSINSIQQQLDALKERPNIILSTKTLKGIPTYKNVKGEKYVGHRIKI